MKVFLIILPLGLLLLGCSDHEFSEVDEIERQEELPVDETYRPLPREFP